MQSLVASKIYNNVSKVLWRESSVSDREFYVKKTNIFINMCKILIHNFLKIGNNWKDDTFW